MINFKFLLVLWFLRLNIFGFGILFLNAAKLDALTISYTWLLHLFVIEPSLRIHFHMLKVIITLWIIKLPSFFFFHSFPYFYFLLYFSMIIYPLILPSSLQSLDHTVVQVHESFCLFAPLLHLLTFDFCFQSKLKL